MVGCDGPLIRVIRWNRRSQFRQNPPRYGWLTSSRLSLRRKTTSRVAQAGFRPGQITKGEFGELQSSISKILAFLSDLDWWIAGVSNLSKDIQPHLSHNENLQLAGTYSHRYLLESCRSMEELEIQVTALFSQLKLRERDGYLSRLHS